MVNEVLFSSRCEDAIKKQQLQQLLKSLKVMELYYEYNIYKLININITPIISSNEKCNRIIIQTKLTKRIIIFNKLYFFVYIIFQNNFIF